MPNTGSKSWGRDRLYLIFATYTESGVCVNYLLYGMATVDEVFESWEDMDASGVSFCAIPISK